MSLIQIQYKIDINKVLINENTIILYVSNEKTKRNVRR